MASPEALAFAKLMTPISPAKPTGDDLRTDTSPTSDYYAIRDARKGASDIERRLDKGEEAPEPPDWRSVVERATRVLEEKTKDLELTAYLIEGLVRTKGFPGLRDGYRLAREMIERFWEGLYPQAVDGPIEDRFSHILHLDGLDGPGALIVPIRKIPLYREDQSGRVQPVHLHQARGLAQLADVKLRQKRIDEGAITLDDPEGCHRVRVRFTLIWWKTSHRSADQVRLFCAALSERSGFDAPSSELLGALETYLDTVKDLGSRSLAKAPQPVAAASASATPAATSTPEPPAPSGAIKLFSGRRTRSSEEGRGLLSRRYT